MKLTFRLRFHTRLGQALLLCGDHELFGGDYAGRAPALHYHNDESWEIDFELTGKPLPGTPVSYFYILRQPDGSAVEDWGGDRKLNLASLADDVLVIDSWNDAGAIANVFYTAPFKKVLLKEKQKQAEPKTAVPFTHEFNIKAPLLPEGHAPCLLGNAVQLGNWNISAPIVLEREPDKDFYSAQLDLSGAQFPIAYKYGVYDLQQKRFIGYEEGGNRELRDAAEAGRQVIVNDGFARLPLTKWKGAGVAIPVFSLRSEESFGTGEFDDLKLLADWSDRAGLKLIQILPVNDTSATHTSADSYPYAAISTFALHPLYLKLSRIATGQNKKRLEKLEPERRRLNALATMDYAVVMRAKLDFVREILPSQKEEVFSNAEYKSFFAQNKHWLVPYAAFCCLRDHFGTADFNQWPEHRVYNEEKITGWIARNSNATAEMELNYFIQFHLHRQLKEVVDYIHARGLVFKGDLAIGVSRASADVWQQPELFHADMQAGAPPDAFAIKGQNWGFPTYDWPRMKADGFAWWKQRLAQMSIYFDAFRIDHILGFFRTWSVPAHAVEGILGRFVPALPVRESDFLEQGIAINRDRLIRPFITDEVIAELFGARGEMVKREFLEPSLPGHYALKKEFTTQRQVENHFAARKKNAIDEKTRDGLFDLISNVILFEVAGREGMEFHFRFDMEKTSSFKQLDPLTQEKLKGLYVNYFFRRQDGLWLEEAMQKLRVLKRVTDMLVCGEDLGMVPACVPQAMRQLGLLSLEIQRLPKALFVDFSHPEAAPYLSVVTPATHDLSTIRGWWEEDQKRTQKFFNQELKLEGEAPMTCEAWISRAIIRQHLDSPAMWSIFQLQDLIGLDEALRHPDAAAERINVPADPKHYWRYRLHLTLEKLTDAENFNSSVKSLIRQAGR